MRPSKQLDLTKGSVMKQLIAFAIPILLANVLQHLPIMPRLFRRLPILYVLIRAV